MSALVGAGELLSGGLSDEVNEFYESDQLPAEAKFSSALHSGSGV
jgi:hypothetical protein